ncbi:MAG: glycosyltransferase family 2 protein [Pseudanabaena sp.]|nr:MAG: glycosyltransferase family 2 protein [Pseudanabaena sp.]
MSKISIILVNYNGQQFLENCLKSILDNLQNTDYEVIIVDNASSDDSIKIIKDDFPSFQLICSDTNLGFGRANNLAVKYSQGDHLLFLNTDTILTENTPKVLSDYLNQNKEVGAVGPRITFQDGSYQISCGKLLNIIVELLYKIRANLDNRWHKFFSILYDRIYSKEQEIGWLTGACLMMRKDVFEKLEGFDELFFMYFEDVDICKRVHDLGLKVVYYPKTSLIHLLGGSGHNIKKKVSVYYRDSQLHYYQKHLGSFQTNLLKLYLKFLNKV